MPTQTLRMLCHTRFDAYEIPPAHDSETDSRPVAEKAVNSMYDHAVPLQAKYQRKYLHLSIRHGRPGQAAAGANLQYKPRTEFACLGGKTPQACHPMQTQARVEIHAPDR